MPRQIPLSDSLIEDALYGAAAGFLATIPMSVLMVIGWRLLPPREQYALPPAEVTGEILEKAGADRMDEQRLMAATLAAHFGFGAATGAGYSLVARQAPVPPAVKGALAALAVWAGSYLGWIPALGILKPASEHPARRNILMILVHLVWGAVLGVAFERMSDERR